MSRAERQKQWDWDGGNTCADCGKPVTRRAERCPACAQVRAAEEYRQSPGFAASQRRRAEYQKARRQQMAVGRPRARGPRVRIDHDYLKGAVLRDGRSMARIEMDANIGQGTIHHSIARKTGMCLEIVDRLCEALGIDIWDLEAVA